MANGKQINKKIAEILVDIAELLEIKGTSFKPAAYRKAAKRLEDCQEDVILLYQAGGKKAIKKIPGIGESIAAKIEEYIKKKKIHYHDELKNETAVRQIITHFFNTKGVSLGELKTNARKKSIVYSRFTSPAKKLLELAGSVEKAKEAISKVAEWANSRGLDYAIETVFKKWLELDRLKPKEIVKKPFYDGHQMVWSETKHKWYVIDQYGSWLEFAGDEKDIEWRVIK